MTAVTLAQTELAASAPLLPTADEFTLPALVDTDDLPDALEMAAFMLGLMLLLTLALTLAPLLV